MSAPNQFQAYIPGRHVVKGIPFKAHKITGMSPESLEDTFETIYGGAIRRLNEIELKIANSDPGSLNKLRKEEQSIATSIVLQEMYFESIGEDGGETLSSQNLEEALIASFGSYEAWRNEFSTTAISHDTRWMVLAWSERRNRLINLCSTGDTSEMFVARPLIVLDMAEYAYLKDFDTDRASYVATFMNNINWTRVSERFQQAINADKVKQEDPGDSQISVADLKAQIDKGDDVVVIDVRHEDDRERYRSRIMETEFRDSFNVSSWAKDLPKDRKVVVYCMYGYWVSMKAAEELREHGIDARSLSGGVLSWRAMGYPSSDNEY